MMQYKGIINMLFSSFPEIQHRYEEEKDYLDGLPHLVFEIIFVPYFKEVMKGDNTYKRTDSVNLLEKMINCDDEKVQEIVVVSVLEAILSDRDFVERIRSDLGIKTKEKLEIIEKEYGWN